MMSEALRKAAEQAIEALIAASGHVHNDTFVSVMMARDALNAALAEPEPSNPVDFDAAFDAVNWDEWRHRPVRELVRELHKVTTPPRREPLTDEQINELQLAHVGVTKWFPSVVRAIEAAHGIGVKP
jgi:hypothetical protein